MWGQTCAAIARKKQAQSSSLGGSEAPGSLNEKTLSPRPRVCLLRVNEILGGIS
ncbi:MAG: hypothetical protein F6K41_24290 [Symploca sp. SIO3E6]|nr:hypothetical protein [Caldora sp. SIO3E6]